MHLPPITPPVVAAAIVAVLLNLSQLMPALKGWWGYILPPKWQWAPGVVITAAAALEQALSSGVISWMQIVVPILFVAQQFAPGAHSASTVATEELARDLTNHPELSEGARTAARRGLAVAQRGKLGAARLVGMTMMLKLMVVVAMLSGCNGTLAKDVESALGFVAKVGAMVADADAWLQQNEAKIVALAPSADRELLQADWDKAQADYRIGVQLTSDGEALTEDALAKAWAAFAVDAEKLATDGQSAGLWKVPAAASSNAIQAGAAPPSPPQDSPPPLPLIVRHLKGQV